MLQISVLHTRWAVNYLRYAHMLFQMSLASTDHTTYQNKTNLNKVETFLWANYTNLIHLIQMRRYKSLNDIPTMCVPLVWSHFQVLVHHKLSKVINQDVAWGAKQPAIVHMKCTFRIISCPVIRSNIYRKMRSCFRFRRSTRRFNNKLIHGVFCLALNERSYILQAMTVFASILTSKIAWD